MPGQVVNAIVIHDGAILMARHPESGLWTLPGGKVEKGETSREALLRELAEELPQFVVYGYTYYHTIGGVTPSSHQHKEFLFYQVLGDGPIRPGAELEQTVWAEHLDDFPTTEVTLKVLRMLRRDGLI